MTVIDLGELRDDVEPDPPTRPPWAVGRPYQCLVVLLAALVTLAGAAPAPRRVVATVPGVPTATAFVIDDRLYVLEPPDPGLGTGSQLVAYRATAGRSSALWRVPLPGDRAVLSGWAVDGRLVLVGRAGDDAGWETLGFDTATGRLGWRRPGMPLQVGDTVLLNAGDGAGADEISRVDPRTGRTLWSVSAPSAEIWLSPGSVGVERLVLRHHSGMVEVFDTGSGARLAARDLRTGEASGRRPIAAAAGLLLMASDTDDTVTGYDLDRLEPRWTASLPMVDFAHSCGRSLCTFRQIGGVSVLDPATGALRWTDPRWSSQLLAADGRLLVAKPTGGNALPLAVVEEETGRLVADLGDWEPVSWDDRDGSIIGVRLSRDGRMMIAELDLAGGPARILDALPDAVGGCRSGETVLVCHRIDGRFMLRWYR
ncbi:PQQ-binding-like beta-propeller repeat protein [Micromonospora sp. NPDC006766]|uniref:outer membrane protein assembly factor BamB family protein n=1 Tax=Micromonospora sp. NPDC006766 TaxID=3154778 RepID=UPI0033FEE4F4